MIEDPGRPVNHGDDLEVVHLLDDPMYIALPRDHKLARAGACAWPTWRARRGW